MSASVLNKTPDRWLLSLDEYTVTQCCIDYALTMLIANGSDSYSLTIETVLMLNLDGNTTTIDVELGPTAMAPVLATVHRQLADVIAFMDGRLELSFADGGWIAVPVNDSFEPWNLVGEDGLRVVSLPGGELALWSPEDSTDRNDREIPGLP